MLKDYVLGSEVAEVGGFHIANISMLFKDFPMIEGVDFLKYGGMTLLNKKSLLYPNNIVKIMYSGKLTDLSPYLPYNYFADELENNFTNVKNKFKKVKIGGKQFVEITDDKLKEILMDDKIVRSVVDNDEIPELVNENYIKGYIKLNSKKSLTWY